MKISVAMAVYNGEKYLDAQIKSIINQLKKCDELIISYNQSTDNTFSIINYWHDMDSRIKIYICYKMGVINNFNNALKYCSGDIIFLSDQDDIWVENKISKILNEFYNNNVDLVIHDAVIVTSNLDNVISDSFFYTAKSRKGILKNIIRNSYCGCCIAFNRKILNAIYPIPSWVPMHDQYIGLIAEKNGKVLFSKNKLIFYRRHNSNVSGRKNLIQMIYNRFLILMVLLKIR